MMNVCNCIRRRVLLCIYTIKNVFSNPVWENSLNLKSLLQSISVCSGELKSRNRPVPRCLPCHRCKRRAGMTRREAMLSRVMSRVTWSRLRPATVSPFTCKISSPIPSRPVYGPSPLLSATFSTYTPETKTPTDRISTWCLYVA